MPNLADLMTSGRNYPTGQAKARTLMEPAAQAGQGQAGVDPAAFGQTLASFLAQSGMTDTLDISGIAKGPTPGQFSLPWGTETLHLLSTGPKDSPGPDELVIVPQQAWQEFGKTRSGAKRQALVDSIVQGTQPSEATVLGGAAY